MPVRLFRPNPLHLLAVAAAGFAGWVASDALTPPGPRPEPAALPPPADVVFLNKRFATLHPGMPRPVVEDHLRGVNPPEVGPVEADGNSAVYRLRYRVLLSHPLPDVAHPGGFAPGPHVVTLVFDARAPGHPLLRVTAEPETAAARQSR